MKKIIFAIVLLAITLTFGCKRNDSNLSIRVKETETTYTYDAVYPVDKTDALEKYIAQQLKSELPMDQNIDATVSLIDGERFKIKATEGVLQVRFDKQNSSVTGFIKMKKFTEGISELLSGK